MLVRAVRIAAIAHLPPMPRAATARSRALCRSYRFAAATRTGTSLTCLRLPAGRRALSYRWLLLRIRLYIKQQRLAPTRLAVQFNGSLPHAYSRLRRRAPAGARHCQRAAFWRSCCRLIPA